MHVFRLLSVLFVFCWAVLEAKQCDMIDLCSCQFEDKTVVDITSLGNTNGTARFKDVLSQEGYYYYYYSYNPCAGFTEDQCMDASACILNPDKSESIQIGDSGKAGFRYDEGSGVVVVAYTSGTFGSLQLTEVLLVCDPNAFEPSIVANGQQARGSFLLTLTTVCACAGGCSAAGPINGSPGVDGGIGLAIVSVVCIVLTKWT